MIIFNESDDNVGYLRLNYFDMDYLVQKYGIDGLKIILTPNQIEFFVESLKQFQEISLLSPYWFYMNGLMITNKQEEKLLDLLSSEAKAGKIVISNNLVCMNNYEIEEKIDELSFFCRHPEMATIEELYLLRSYLMYDYVYENIDISEMIENTPLEEYDNAMEARLNLEEREEILEEVRYMGFDRYVISDDFWSNHGLKLKRAIINTTIKK